MPEPDRRPTLGPDLEPKRRRSLGQRWHPALLGLGLLGLAVALGVASAPGQASILSRFWDRELRTVQAADAPLPVPRFVSLRSDKVNVRAGPGVRYPIEWVFERKGMPVEVVAEYENFRKVRDIEGTEGWVHMNLLSSRRGIIITGVVRTIRREPHDDSPAVARAEPDVIGLLLECQGDWCRVDLSGFRGWLKRTEFWGVFPDEKIE
jgi:SH3-like domain-containing protein